MRCVIFDMDGVIIDSEPIHMQCEREMLNSFNISISVEEHNTYVGTSDKVMWQKIKSQYGLALAVDELIELKKKYYMDYLRR